MTGQGKEKEGFSGCTTTTRRRVNRSPLKPTSRCAAERATDVSLTRKKLLAHGDAHGPSTDRIRKCRTERSDVSVPSYENRAGNPPPCQAEIFAQFPILSRTLRRFARSFKIRHVRHLRHEGNGLVQLKICQSDANGWLVVKNDGGVSVCMLGRLFTGFWCHSWGLLALAWVQEHLEGACSCLERYGGGEMFCCCSVGIWRLKVSGFRKCPRLRSSCMRRRPPRSPVDGS